METKVSFYYELYDIEHVEQIKIIYFKGLSHYVKHDHIYSYIIYGMQQHCYLDMNTM